MSRKRASLEDPRGVIAESYFIDPLTMEAARSIFLDWAMMDAPENPGDAIVILLERHQKEYPDHPMTAILREGLTQPEQRVGRKGRQGRKNRLDKDNGSEAN